MIIAQTIREQLITLGRIEVMSWGSHNWQGGNDFLQFKVQGFKFKGIVKITYMPTDVYKIEFIKKNEIVETYNDVYFDEMVNIIDNYVEYTGKNYANDVNKAVYKF
ncbi:MAG TPA: hypothetical protein VNG53_02570 [Bacteroidia bacterium]|nr:hypothetical protein [Bacteroidia bacterium]